MNFSNLQEGAFGLLAETADILNRNKINYIIVGGWSPLLLNNNPIVHPGTKDVDILFENGYRKKELGKIILKFIDSGFLLSAKHDFQLFKEIEVHGKKFIYNIDLLHPTETQKPEEIYIDHIDLGIPSDKYQSNTFKMKSIALPSSQALFDNKIPKRFRDSLDIYLAITQNSNKEFYSELKKLKNKNPDSFNTVYGIKEFYDQGDNMYVNTLKYIPNLEMKVFKKEMGLFFEKSGLNKKAKH